jgi:predicted component of type VI protein secretion system
MRRYRIGRADTNDIVLADTTVSREHAELVELGGGRYEIKDLGSTFGIAVWEGQDWAKVTACELRQDSRLRLGEFQTTIADLLRDTDKTVVRRAAEPTAPPRPPDRTTPPPPREPSAPPREATAPPRREPTAPPSSPSREPTTPPAREAMAPPPLDAEKTEPPARPPRPAAPAPPKPAAAPSPAPPRPAPPRPAPPRPAPPRPAPPRPASDDEGTAVPSSAPPRPAAPAAPAFQFLRNMSPEKRTLLWIGVGFAGFLFISLITLILVLVL